MQCTDGFNNYYTYSVRAHTIRTIIPFENWKWKHGRKNAEILILFFYRQGWLSGNRTLFLTWQPFLHAWYLLNITMRSPLVPFSCVLSSAVIQAPNWPLWFGTPWFAYAQGGSLWTLFNRLCSGAFAFFLFFSFFFQDMIFFFYISFAKLDSENGVYKC